MKRPEHLKRVMCEIQVPYIVDLKPDDHRLLQLSMAAQAHHYALDRPKWELRADAGQNSESSPVFIFRKSGLLRGAPYKRILVLRPHALSFLVLDFEGVEDLKRDLLPLTEAFFDAFEIDLVTRMAARYSNAWVCSTSTIQRFPAGFFDFATENDLGEVSQYAWRMQGRMATSSADRVVEYIVQVGKGQGEPAVADVASLVPKSPQGAIVLDIECFTSDLDRAHIENALDVTHRSAEHVFGWLYRSRQERRAHGESIR